MSNNNNNGKQAAVSKSLVTKQTIARNVVPVQVKNVGVQEIRRKIGLQSRIDIRLFKPKGKIKCFAFLHTGSQLSFIRRSLLSKVKYESIYSWRTGSTFLGELLTKTKENTFYR